MALLLNTRAKVAITSFLLFCVSLFLTAYSARHPEIARLGFSALSEIQRPFQLIENSFNNTVIGLWDDYINLIDVNQKNRALKARVDVLEALNSRLLEFQSENERLKKLLGFIEEQKLSAISANIIGYDPTGLSQTAIIDRGSGHGVHEGMPLVVGDGVVGQIVTAGPRSSKALLITDPSSGVDAIVQGSRVRGVVRGTARPSLCEMLYVLRDDQIKVGDRIITSGMDGVFPKGLLIGIVSDVGNRATGMFQSVEVRPSVDFHKLENVLVVMKKEPL